MINPEQVDRIQQLAGQLGSARVAHVNATNNGGGVAEILNSFVLLINDLGVPIELGRQAEQHVCHIS
ncbi:MAG TPA: hypothetical protein VGA52_01375 [Anaerolineales bacterium]